MMTMRVEKDLVDSVAQMDNDKFIYSDIDCTTLEDCDLDIIKRPQPDDIILLRFDLEDLTLDGAHALHQHISEMFPDNIVISLPISCQLKQFKKEEFEEIIENLRKVYLAAQDKT